VGAQEHITRWEHIFPQETKYFSTIMIIFSGIKIGHQNKLIFGDLKEATENNFLFSTAPKLMPEGHTND
jgi:hypothetical protein